MEIGMHNVESVIVSGVVTQDNSGRAFYTREIHLVNDRKEHITINLFSKKRKNLDVITSKIQHMTSVDVRKIHNKAIEG